jgi:hypothetical protein
MITYSSCLSVGIDASLILRRLLPLMLCFGAIALSQNSEDGHVERNGSKATLVVDSPRPVDSAAISLANEFGIRVNVEDPPYSFRDDVKDVTARVSRDRKIQRPVLIPKGGRLEILFSLASNGQPANIPNVVRSLADAANARFPFAYRLDIDGNWFTLVPTRTRDSLGHQIRITPLLDRHVTIPAGTRSIATAATLMAQELSAQTGMHVSCCQGAVAGIPWGLVKIAFSANNEPARNVLKRLIKEASGNQPNRDYWLERCDPSSRWCAINLTHIAGPLSALQTQPLQRRVTRAKVQYGSIRILLHPCNS